jgi:hypothetical protein
MLSNHLPLGGIVFVLSMTLLGCKGDESKPVTPVSSSLVGTWVRVASSTDTYILTCSQAGDFTYEISHRTSQSAVVNAVGGRYSTSGNIVTIITYTDPTIVGQYSFVVTTTTLSFSVIADSSAERRQVLAGSYTRR